MQDGKLTTYDPNDDPAFQRPRDEPSADDGLPQRAHGLTLREASALWEDERKPAFIAIDGSAWRAPLRSDEIAKGGTYYLNGWVSKSRTVRGSAPFSRAPEVKLVVSKDRRAARVSIPGLGQRELALQALGQGVTRAGASYTSSLDGRAPDMELELRDGGPDVGVTHFRLRWGDWGDPGTFHLTGADVTASPVNRFGPARDASQLPP
jgi:hypothetical protein